MHRGKEKKMLMMKKKIFFACPLCLFAGEWREWMRLYTGGLVWNGYEMERQKDFDDEAIDLNWSDST